MVSSSDDSEFLRNLAQNDYMINQHFLNDGKRLNEIASRLESHKPMADSPTTEYRYCLDALIATISDMKDELAGLYEHGYGLDVSPSLEAPIARAEERATELAGRLAEKYA